MIRSLAWCVALAIAAPALAQTPQDATRSTREANEKLHAYLPFSNQQDFEDARRGFIADVPNPVIKGEAGNTVIDLAQYDFLKSTGEAPATVNPSLWRQSQLLAIRGLFKVVDGIYQVRNIDLANITFIRGKTGWIVIDPLTSTETAKVAHGRVVEALSRPPQPNGQRRGNLGSLAISPRSGPPSRRPAIT
jgi:alkyl sulfatase BDS1-like metallo-beta-lactamase superfamily hydrolase